MEYYGEEKLELQRQIQKLERIKSVVIVLIGVLGFTAITLAISLYLLWSTIAFFTAANLYKMPYGGCNSQDIASHRLMVCFLENKK